MKTVLALIIALNIAPAFAGSLIVHAGDSCAKWSCTFPPLPGGGGMDSRFP